jgi:hypothetical protein
MCNTATNTLTKSWLAILCGVRESWSEISMVVGILYHADTKLASCYYSICSNYVDTGLVRFSLIRVYLYVFL